MLNRIPLRIRVLSSQTKIHIMQTFLFLDDDEDSNHDANVGPSRAEETTPVTRDVIQADEDVPPSGEAVLA